MTSWTLPKTEQVRITKSMVDAGLGVMDSNVNVHCPEEWRRKFVEEIYMAMRDREMPIERVCPSRAVR